MGGRDGIPVWYGIDGYFLSGGQGGNRGLTDFSSHHLFFFFFAGCFGEVREGLRVGLFY